MYDLIKSTLSFPFLFFVIFVLLCVYAYFKFVAFSYWKKLGVPYDEPIVPFGSINVNAFLKKITLGNALRESYEKFKNHRYHGLYMLYAPVMMINDVELIKRVLVKDFTYFYDRGASYDNSKFDPMSANLFLLVGEKWRAVRAKLTPAFTSGKLKQMFSIIKNIADGFTSVIESNLKSTNIQQIKEISQRYTTDVIFDLAFGIDSNTLKVPNNPFHYNAELMIKVNQLVTALTFFTPRIPHILRLRLFHPGASKFLSELFFEMVDKRKKDKIKRNDVLNMLIEVLENGQMKNQESSDKEDARVKFDPDLVAAQAFVFFTAGQETTSSTISLVLYELSVNPEIQEKLHCEIDKHLLTFNNEINYENLKNFEYLEMVINETLRKHSFLPFLHRTCVRDYKIPDSNVTIPKGMQVLISAVGIHNNPDYYPDPDKFDPTRFNKRNTECREPVTFLAFGEGPRICIGLKLAMMVTKIAVFELLTKFKFSVCEKTVIPADYSTETVIHMPKDGVYLHVERRKKLV